MPATPTTPEARGRAVRAVAAVAVLVATSGCSVADLVTGEKTQHYDTVADAPVRGELAFVLPEGLVPDDATDITVRVKTDAPDLKAYDWASDSGRLAADCEPSGPATDVHPFYTSGGWPDEATEVAGHRCPLHHVTEVDGHHYAWQVS